MRTPERKAGYTLTVITRALILFVAIIILSKLFIPAFWLLISACSFIAGAIITIVLIARSRGELPKDVMQEVVQQAVNPDPNAIVHRVEEQLTRLNEKLRLNCSSVLVISKTEELIDLLLDVVPLIILESPNSEASFDLEKLSTDYFPNLLGDYLELSRDDQASTEETFLKQLLDLADVINAAKSSFDSGNLDSFQISSAFLRAKTA